MPQIPDNLAHRTALLRAKRDEKLAHDNMHATEEQQRQSHDTVEALALGKHYTALLKAASIYPVNIYDNVPTTGANSLKKLGTTYSYKDPGEVAGKTPGEIDQMLEPTGKGWVTSYGADTDGDYTYPWILGLSYEGEVLSSFIRDAPGDRSLTVLNGRAHELAGGIIRPERLFGSIAIRSLQDDRFLDGLAWILDGNSPLDCGTRVVPYN